MATTKTHNRPRVDLLLEHGAALQQLRRMYLQEVRRFAEELRPMFVAGELRGWRDGDGETPARPPLFVLEDLCATRFGIDEAQKDFDEACRRAYLIRLVSPHEHETEDGQPVQSQAQAALALDVLDVARERGWTAGRGRRSGARRLAA